MAKFQLPEALAGQTGWFAGYLFVNGVTEVAPAQAGTAGELLKRYYSVTEVGEVPPPSEDREPTPMPLPPGKPKK